MRRGGIVCGALALAGMAAPTWGMAFSAGPGKVVVHHLSWFDPVIPGGGANFCVPIAVVAAIVGLITSLVALPATKRIAVDAWAVSATFGGLGIILGSVLGWNLVPVGLSALACVLVGKS